MGGDEVRSRVNSKDLVKRSTIKGDEIGGVASLELSEEVCKRELKLLPEEAEEDSHFIFII